MDPDRVDLALELVLPHQLGVELIPEEPQGRLADQDPARALK